MIHLHNIKNEKDFFFRHGISMNRIFMTTMAREKRTEEDMMCILTRWIEWWYFLQWHSFEYGESIHTSKQKEITWLKLFFVLWPFFLFMKKANRHSATRRKEKREIFLFECLTIDVYLFRRRKKNKSEFSKLLVWIGYISLIQHTHSHEFFFRGFCLQL